MDHSYAKQKLSLLVRDIANYNNDEFRRQMARIVSGATGQDIPDDCHTIKAERDSILAELQKANGIIIDLQHNPLKLAKEFLAEIKAEAIEAFCKSFDGLAIDQTPTNDDCSEDMVIGWKAGNVDCRIAGMKYAAKIRNTGTWLKDSNVNGGKRQGGEE